LSGRGKHRRIFLSIVAAPLNSALGFKEENQMCTQNIRQLLMDLQSISDFSLEQGLQDIAVNIDDGKFSNALVAF
jgi:hypothetical protein